MSTETPESETRLLRNRGRESRTQSVATRFTRAEERELLKKAEASGQNLREWAREVLLRNAEEGRHSEMEMHIFSECVLHSRCVAPPGALD
jgi:repressor of nif and glnA expression